MRRTKGKVFSLLLRNGKYVLMQILNKQKEVVVFNQFRENDNWDDFTLSEEKILFRTTLAMDFYRNSTLAVHKKKPLELEREFKFLHLGNGHRKKTLWENTPDEIEIPLLGSPDDMVVIEYDVINGSEEYEVIRIQDYERVKHLEIDALHIWPLINERLYIISELGLDYNYSVYRELAFDREIPRICKVWADINTGNKEVYTGVKKGDLPQK